RTKVRGRQGALDFRLVAIQGEGESVYRFRFVTPPKLTDALAKGFKRTTYSFHRLSPGEAAQIKPRRLRLYRVRPGDTPSGISGRMAFESYRLQRFLVLNGLDEKDLIRPGQTVKIVTE
ncbi:MAG: LysM peptidoglycan-binding domain-containing protein, partial [Rhodospirillales bacterium]|nr:LysM peptidoglycan-binding domain-containing protein [Rhodospirillales bacterium]